MTSPDMRYLSCPPGGPLVLARRARPEPKEGEILIEAHAAGVNYPDLMQRSGAYPKPANASDILGLEAAGVVVELGPGATRWRIGDRVTALLNGGGYAEYVAVPEGAALPWPDNLDAAAAAALPETVFTVWANVFESGALQPGETLLVHGGAGGIGVAAIQMAKAHGARVIATAGAPEKLDLCRRLGADLAVNYRTQDFEEAVKAEGGADVILDMVGGPYLQKNLNALRERGRLVQIAFREGARAEVDLMRLMLKRLTITGSTLRSRSDAEKARLAAEVERAVWPWVAQGKLRAVIDGTYRLEDGEAAHQRMISGAHAGKIVLQVRA